MDQQEQVPPDVAVFETARVRVIHDVVALQRIAAAEEEATPGGIVIPERYRDRCTRARVLAVGPGRPQPRDGRLAPVPLQKGQVVLVQNWTGAANRVPRHVGIAGEDVHLARYDEILAVLEAD